MINNLEERDMKKVMLIILCANFVFMNELFENVVSRIWPVILVTVK